VNIIGYHISLNNACNSLGEVCLNDLLSFVLAQKGDCIKVLYHLDYSVACILKLLNINEKACEALSKTTDLKVNDLSFQYIPKKWFSIRRGNEWCGFSDMAQYNNGSPLKIEQTVDDCMAYANESQLVGEKVYKVLTDTIGLHPKTLTSPVSAYEKEVLCNVDLPTVDDLPSDVAWYAYQTCHGPWMESYKKGHFAETWDYDLRSAYGFQLSKLVDIRQNVGKWIHTTGFMNKALYGYCHGIVTITSDFSPIIYSYENAENSFTPKGSWETYLTKQEVDFINKRELGSFQIIDGWYFVPKVVVTDYHKPFKPLVSSLFQKKESSEEFASGIIKRVLSGMWGRTLELRHDRMGDGFNPVFGAEVECNTRLSVADFVLRHDLKDNLLSVTLDGVLSSHPAQQFIDNGEIGTWKLSSHCPTVVVSSGIVAVRDKQRQGIFAVEYDWLMESIKSKPKESGYVIKGNSPVNLGKAMMNRFGDLGKIEERKITLNVGDELKRDYVKYPKCGGDLLENIYESKPWDIKDIQQIETMPAGVE
jgi:hypothetical protein